MNARLAHLVGRRVDLAVLAGLLMMPAVIALGFWSERRVAPAPLLADLRGSIDATMSIR